MGKISEIIRNNKFYFGLFIFIVLINSLVFLGWMAERAEKAQEAETVLQEGEPLPEEEAAPGTESMFDDEEMRARQEKIEKLAQENPILYLFLGLANLAILFVVFIGLILDVYFLARWLKREPVHIRIIQEVKPGWSIGDIVRVVLIFLSFGYVFVILQSFVAKLFPILYNENFRMVFNTAVMNVVGIGVILYFIARKYGQKISAIGLTSKKVGSSVFYAVVGYIALVPVLLAIMVATFFVTKLIGYKPPVQPIVQVFIEEKETAVLWFSAVFAAVFGPVAEEVFFRGFMYPAIKKKLGILGAMLVTAALFSFLHTHIVGFLPIMVLGLLLTYLYEKTGSLVPSMVVHITHNLGMVLLVFLMKYIGT